MSIIEKTLKQRAKAMHPKPEFRLSMSPLTRSIYAGRVKDLGNGTSLATGVRHDVTNDFLGVVIQYGESHGGAFEIIGGGESYDVTVTKRATQAAKQGAQP